MKCETLEAATAIRHAAHSRKDENILLIIEGENLVVREAMYHRHRYQRYTYEYNKTDTEDDDVYEQFCQDLIQKRIIERGEIFHMNKLDKLYAQTQAMTSEKILSIS